MDKRQKDSEADMSRDGRKMEGHEEKVEAADDVSSVTHGASTTGSLKAHPSRSLGPRAKGYGIGGGYERPYTRDRSGKRDSRRGLYGPLPHSGYYGSGTANRPFKTGQASFSDELEWYRKQYGERTSGFDDAK